jgi:DNA end-binding protein Ku
VPEHDEENESFGGGRGRPIWSGTITFGLVSVPVQLVSGNRGNRVSLHMVTENGTQLARRYFTEHGRKPLTDDDIVRGFAVSKDKYVVLEEEDLERLAPEVTRDIDLSSFVPAEDVDPMYFVRAYYLIPGPGGAKAYRLLARVMEDTGRAGIARFVMRGKEYLVALIAENGILRAETLRFADELRSPKDVGLPKPSRVTAADTRKMTTQMKKLYKAKFSPKELADTMAAELLSIAKKKKRAGDDVVKLKPAPDEEPVATGDVIDLMERLKRSLKTNGKSEARKAPRKKATKRRSTAKKHRSTTKKRSRRKAA